MIKNFRHACIIVSNLKRSLKFYRDILGLKVDKILSLKGRYPQTILQKKGIRLTYVKMHSPSQSKNRPPVFELHYWKNPRISPCPGYNHISFTVKDIDDEYKRLTKLGVKFLSPPQEGPQGDTKICFAYDPDKHLIEFVEDLR